MTEYIVPAKMGLQHVFLDLKDGIELIIEMWEFDSFGGSPEAKCVFSSDGKLNALYVTLPLKEGKKDAYRIDFTENHSSGELEEFNSSSRAHVLLFLRAYTIIESLLKHMKEYFPGRAAEIKALDSMLRNQTVLR
jgi:hypothetical protein